jgi:hypothetical protein
LKSGPVHTPHPPGRGAVDSGSSFTLRFQAGS